MFFLDLLQRFPMFPGKMRLVRLLFRRLINSAQNIRIGGSGNIKYFLPNLKESIGQDILANGVYEPEIVKLIVDNLGDHEAMLDIGANIGAISIPVAVRCKLSQIYAIEASTSIFDYLIRNIKINEVNNIDAFHLAVSHQDNSELPFYSPSEKYGKGSFSPVFTSNAEMVATCTLDSFIKCYNIRNLSVIKVDVEGYEYHVFKGAKMLLAGEHAPRIIFEFVDWAEREADGVQPGMAQQLLLDYGYTLYKVHRAGRAYRLTPVEHVLTSGSCMILAMKNVNKD